MFLYLVCLTDSHETGPDVAWPAHGHCRQRCCRGHCRSSKLCTWGALENRGLKDIWGTAQDPGVKTCPGAHSALGSQHYATLQMTPQHPVSLWGPVFLDNLSEARRKKIPSASEAVSHTWNSYKALGAASPFWKCHEWD